MSTFPGKSFLPPFCAVLLAAHSPGAEPKPFVAELKPGILKFDAFIWPDATPEACPFERSGEFNAIRFLGVKSGFRCGDTWYPTCARTTSSINHDRRR